jgi:hypothetical protein
VIADLVADRLQPFVHDRPFRSKSRGTSAAV